MYSTSQEYKSKILKSSTIHELNIYIDGNKVEPNHIVDFKQTIQLFNNEEFCLGCTPEIDIEFEIDRRDLPETYNEVYVESGLEEEIIPIGHFTIQKPIEDDELKVKIKATDYMKKFEDGEYDGSDLEYPITLLELLKDICKKVGVELGSTSFLNSNKQIATYDSTISPRTLIGYIAEQAGGFATIGRDGKLYIKNISQDIVNLDIDLFEDYIWGDAIKISRVSYEDGIQDYKFGSNDNDTLYVDTNNMYIIDKEQIENIYNTIKNLEVYSFEGRTIIDPAYDIGDILIIDNKLTIYQGELEYAGKFIATINSKLQAKTEQESMQTKESTSKKIRKIKSTIDQIEGKITQIVEENDENSNKVSETIQTLDKISQKVNSIENLTREKKQVNNLFLNDAQEGENYILDLYIYGNTKKFIQKNITIASSSEKRGYGKTINITNENGEDILTEDRENIVLENENFYINYCSIILDDLLRSLEIDNQKYYDYIHIHQNGTIEVVRKIGINENGDLYLLDKEKRTILDKKLILPTKNDGVYYFIEEIPNLEYKVKYIVANEYSNTYITKYESESAINIAKNSIEMYVNEKTDTDELISKINMKPGRIDMTGIVTANENFKILQDGSIEAKNGSFSGNIYLDDGNKVIGGDGMLSNMQFLASGMVGYDFNWTGANTGKNIRVGIYLVAFIPENFKVTSAKLSLYSSPIACAGINEGDSDIIGYSSNVNIYKTDDIAKIAYVGGTAGIASMEIPQSKPNNGIKAFGNNGVTFSGSKDTAISGDISTSLENGNNVLLLADYTGTPGTSYKNGCKKTGFIYAFLNIIGYMSIKK